MPHDPRKLLADILSAATAINEFCSGKGREDYSADLLLRSAVERQLEILGEAIRRLETRDAEMVSRLTDHRRIIAFRNLIAHGYDALDDDIVWQIVQEKLPVLTAESVALLRELDPTR